MTDKTFETTWLREGQEIERRTAKVDSMDAALVAAWLDMPAIARKARKPCDTMHITDVEQKQTLTEDVPPFTVPSRGIGNVILIFMISCGALWLGIWMARHGWVRANDIRSSWTIKALFAAPMACLCAIVYAATRAQSRQDAIAQWKKDYGDLHPATAPAQPRMARIILAHFSFWRIAPITVVLLVAGAALIWIPFAPFVTHKQGKWEDLVWLAFGNVLLALVWPTLHQLLFDGSAALWIRGGMLLGCDSRFLTIPIWSITGVTVEEYTPPKGFSYNALMISTGDKKMPVSPRGFIEPAEDIAARLNDLLRLAH